MNPLQKSTNILQIVGNRTAEVLLSKVSENTWVQALNAFDFGVLILDFDGKINYWNAIAEKLTGYSAHFLLKKNVFEIIPETNQPKFHKKWHQLITERHAVELKEYYWPTQSWLHLYAYPSNNDIIIYFKDISEYIGFKKKLHFKTHQLKELSVFNSHEIRKSIANLIGLTNLLNIETSLKEVQEYSHYINSCAKELDGISTKLSKLIEKVAPPLNTQLSKFSLKQLAIELKNEMEQSMSYLKLKIYGNDGFFYGNRANLKTCLETVIGQCLIATTSVNFLQLRIFSKDGLIFIKVRNMSEQKVKAPITYFHQQLSDTPCINHNADLIKANQVCQDHNGSLWVDVLPSITFTVLLPISHLSSFKTPKTTLPTTVKSGQMVINYNLSEQCLHVEWIGHFDETSRKNNFFKLNTLVKSNSYLKIINDETAVIGGNTNSINWLCNFGFPLLIKSGVKKFAWVTSSNEFAKLSAGLVIKRLNTPSNIKTFNHIHSATAWISKKGTENT